ncbi:MAG TPA: aspartyl protease family protein [Thermoplasmata archaeon]|nr:aspartyl protease family protein [Thermoplasmata archaeon]
MGTFAVQVRLPDGREAEVFVDTGATFSKLPARDLESLGVQPSFEVEVELGDGTVARRDVGYVELEVQERRRIVPVAFGGVGERSLLGATALEILGFAVDPSRQELVPTRSLEIWGLSPPETPGGLRTHA